MIHLNGYYEDLAMLNAAEWQETIDAFECLKKAVGEELLAEIIKSRASITDNVRRLANKYQRCEQQIWLCRSRYNKCYDMPGEALDSIMGREPKEKKK